MDGSIRYFRRSKYLSRSMRVCIIRTYLRCTYRKHLKIVFSLIRVIWRYRSDKFAKHYYYFQLLESRARPKKLIRFYDVFRVTYERLDMIDLLFSCFIIIGCDYIVFIRYQLIDMAFCVWVYEFEKFIQSAMESYFSSFY